MSYCPKCKYEYEPGITICPDCNEILVDVLPDKSRAARPPDDSWVGVCGIKSTVSADMAQGALENANIPSTIISSSFTPHGRGLDFLSGISLTGKGINIVMVPKEYHDDAELILENILGDDFIPFQST